MTNPTPQPLSAPQRRWPLLVIGASAGTAVWSGWVGLGELVGFGVVHPLPGIWDDLTLNTAITLPIGVEAYAMYALSVATSTAPITRAARRFAWISSVAALGLGMVGQVAYHLMNADGLTAAPWPIVAGVSCLPVLVLGVASVLWHLAGTKAQPETTTATEAPPAAETPAATGLVQPVDSRPHRTRTRSNAGTTTAGRIAQVRARHPGWSTAQIAEHLGISARTARRYSVPDTTALARDNAGPGHSGEQVSGQPNGSVQHAA